VCGRTLLRGEHAEVYVSGGSRRSVCELCTSRALQGGWVREGTVPEYDGSNDRPDRRRSLLSRLRSRRDVAPEIDPEGEDGPVFEEPRVQPPAPEWPDPPARTERRTPGSRRRERNAARERERSTGATGSAAAGSSASARDRERERNAAREPRHVRAVPTSVENRISSAVSLFNDSEHPRTVSGIARSLGLPDVSVHPSDPVASVVNVVVSWELCWYRYEVDLSDEVPSVRSAGQGYELDELSVLERQNNATADDRGRLHLG
jgi:hypothetical protein